MSEDTVQEGVNNTETTDASPAEKPATSETQESQDTGSTSEKQISESVPYERFAEVNNKNKALEKSIEEIRQEMEELKKPSEPQAPVSPEQEQQEQQIREQLKKMGFISKEELELVEEDRKLQSTLEKLETKYDGSDGRPKFDRVKVLSFAKEKGIADVDGAYNLLHQPELIDFAIKQAQGKTKPVKSETSDGSGSSEAGTTRGDLIKAAQKGDKGSVRDLIKRAIQ